MRELEEHLAELQSFLFFPKAKLRKLQDDASRIPADAERLHNLLKSPD
jgi:hypothetical protein